MTRLLLLLSPTRRRINHLLDLRVFCNVLASMLEGGLTLPRALALTATHTDADAPDLRQAVEEVADDVANGKPFATALQRQHPQFPTAMRTLAAVGELADDESPDDPRKLAILLRAAAAFYADDVSYLRSRLILR